LTTVVAVPASYRPVNRHSRQDYFYDANYQTYVNPYSALQPYNNYNNTPLYGNNYRNPLIYQNSGPSVNCGKVEVSPGVFNFDCSNVNSNDITLKNEHIVGFGANGGVQEINIPVTNYKIEELIRGSIADARLKTLVNVLVQKPQSLYNVEAARQNKITLADPDVNVRYEGVSPSVQTFHHNSDNADYNAGRRFGNTVNPEYNGGRRFGNNAIPNNYYYTSTVRPETIPTIVEAFPVPNFGLRKRMVMVNGKLI